MSDEIVRLLRNRNKQQLNFLKESLSSEKIYEEEESEEEEDLPTDTTEEETPSEVDITREENDGEEFDAEGDSSEEEEYVDPEGDTEEDNKEDTEDTTEYVNPLDNIYAVKHTIGEEVLIAYANGTNSKLKGTIDGYDTEGFYRVLWSNGLTTNGITDLALSSIVKSTRESSCVCGNSKFVTEGKYVVCDECGRYIKESLDQLTLADKSRPEGKKMIRSEAHPVSTAGTPDISESIRKVLKSIKESDSEDVWHNLRSLDREFWTRQNEMVADIEELGYEVEEINSEYVLVSYDDYEMQIPIAGTSRTMTLDFNKARML